jgi:nicotinamide riboside kinase
MIARPIVMDFVGSHSTGKTTCIQHVKTILTRLQISYKEIPSTSRKEANQMFSQEDLYHNVGDFLQAWISMTNWANILESIQHYDVTLCTDLGVRSLAYTLTSSKTNSKTEIAHKKMVDYFSSSLFSSAVDVYRIYLPIEFEVVQDGIRTTDTEFSKRFDNNLHYIFSTLNIPTIKLSGSISERNIQLTDLLNRIFLNKCSVEYDRKTNSPNFISCDYQKERSEK